MKEHPIIMSTELVKAILEGRKTITRRVIKPRRISRSEAAFMSLAMGKPSIADLQYELAHPEKPNLPCPFGQVGDRLWMRETWKLEMHSGCFDIAYKDGKLKDAGSNLYMTKYSYLKDRCWVWRPSIFMPRWASRITLEIIGVRVERLQGITGKDAIAEGVPHCSCKGHEFCEDKIHDYAVYWDSLNAKRGFSWASNPFVWVIKFKRLLRETP